MKVEVSNDQVFALVQQMGAHDREGHNRTGPATLESDRLFGLEVLIARWQDGDMRVIRHDGIDVTTAYRRHRLASPPWSRRLTRRHPRSTDTSIHGVGRASGSDRRRDLFADMAADG